MKHLILLLIILLAGCDVQKTPANEPMVLDTPISITIGDVPEGDSAGSAATPSAYVPRTPDDPPALPKRQSAASGSVKADPTKPADEVKRNMIFQFTIKSCGWCKYDRERVLPKWVDRGWIWRDKADHVIDETENPQKGGYPRYEIYDNEGKKTVHHGSLLTWKP
jgi:hypothetical protein